MYTRVTREYNVTISPHCRDVCYTCYSNVIVMRLSHMYPINMMPTLSSLAAPQMQCHQWWQNWHHDNYPWWRHQMKAFSALLAFCVGNSPVTGEFPSERPMTRSFDVFFDLHLNKQLSKQSWGWWFETPSRPLWCHSNAVFNGRC